MREGPGCCVSLVASAAGLALFAVPAAAQTTGPSPRASHEVEQLLVTARYRQETDMSVPVSIAAISADQIERQAILNFYDVAQRFPSLSVNNNTSGLGGTVFLRGIGTAAATASSLDQSVSFSIDGAPISRGNVLRLGEYDLAQIEILKGPQALFFGKNSTAGVLSFKSNEPTSEFEFSSKLAYEPNANNRFAELVVSGPLAEGLQGRLFLRAAKSDGEKKNLAALALPANLIVPGAVWAPSHDKAWGVEDNFVRGTLLIEPSRRLTLRLTASYDKQDGDNVSGIKERYYCPRGVAQFATTAAILAAGSNLAAFASALAVDDCQLNGVLYQGDLNPSSFRSPTPSRRPGGDTRSRISLSVAEVNYALTDRIRLTSITAHAFISERAVTSFSYSPAFVPALAFYNNTRHHQLTQETRITTDFEFPLNFMVGGFYQDTDFSNFSWNFAVPPHNRFQFNIPNKVYSAFAEGIWNVTTEVELAAGVRLTKEKKRLLLTRDDVVQLTASPKVTFDDASPEATLTWRPSSHLTTYVAYKTGFKSGGYASTLAGNLPPLASTPPLQDFLYRPESAEGFEVGVKAAMPDRALRFDATVYAYEYGDLQVSSVTFAAGNTPVIRVFNAAKAKQRGVEVEGTYDPPQTRNLRLYGFANYNRSRYSDFISPCYIGQSTGEGCNIGLAGNGAFTSQDLSGRQLTNAPLWVGSAGFNYSTPVGRARLELGADAAYRSSYNATADLSPGGMQRPSIVFNAQLRLVAVSRSWELGIYGKNLSNAYRALESSPAPLTGNSAVTGTAAGNVSARADLVANSNPGRAVMVQLVVRPGAWTRD
jgi:iron complex outermembrane receptor protein